MSLLCTILCKLVVKFQLSQSIFIFNFAAGIFILAQSHEGALNLMHFQFHLIKFLDFWRRRGTQAVQAKWWVIFILSTIFL